MNRLYVLGSILLAGAGLLSACGGGGSAGPVPTTNPTVTPTNPPISYSSKLVFIGPMDRSVQADLRQAEDSSTASPIPIMVVSAPESGTDVSQYGGQVEAVVSPQPSATPAVSFANTNPDAVLATPSGSPQPMPTGVIAEAIVTGSNAVQSQVSGTATATIGAPVNQTPSTAVYSYMSIALDEGSGPVGIAGSGYTLHSGWKWSSGTWAPDDNANDADIYIANDTIYIPGGDTRISTDTAFNAVAASQWSNTETSFTLTQANTQNPDGSANALVIGKTRDGQNIFKLFPNAIGFGHGFFGAIEVSGSSVDGF